MDRTRPTGHYFALAPALAAGACGVGGDFAGLPFFLFEDPPSSSFLCEV